MCASEIIAPRWRDPQSLREAFSNAEPFPNLVLDDFLQPDVAMQAALAFPTDPDATWTSYLHYNERKFGMTELSAFPDPLRRVAAAFCERDVVAWLEAATGIDRLLPDPTLEGGGLHATRRGGYLRLHTDFTGHHHKPNWRRRLNLIVFLNPDWEVEWGGDLELWTADLKQCRARIGPLLNRAVLFRTDGASFHGYPDPIACPPGVVRKSLALYYYTEETGFARRTTEYRARPSERGKASWIWLDTRLVAVYSALKRRLGLSDRLASTLLRRFFRS